MVVLGRRNILVFMLIHLVLQIFSWKFVYFEYLELILMLGLNFLNNISRRKVCQDPNGRR
jgi:hypothetical protein